MGDSFSAVQVCEVLKKVANAGASVLFTIHQPSSEIFDSFDHLILLNKGRVMYHGSVNDVPAYFEERGNPVPSRYNPADWIMNVAQSIPVAQLNEKGFFPDDDRKMGDPINDDELDGADALGITGITMTGHDSQSSQYRDEKLRDESKVSMQVQTRMLFLRELKGFGRDTAALIGRFGITIFLSLIVGIIFLGVGKTDSRDPINLQSQFGALIMVLMMAMMGTSSAALMAFPEERPVFLREYSTNHYSVISYFASRLTMEAFITALQVLVMSVLIYFFIGLRSDFQIVFLSTYVLAMASTAIAVMLGCAVEDTKLGQEMLPLLFVPQMLFSGIFVAPHLMPSWLQWARYLCSLTYAVRILVVEEFNREDCITCKKMMETVDADPNQIWLNWLILILLFVGFRLLALIILKQKATKFF